MKHTQDMYILNQLFISVFFLVAMHGCSTTPSKLDNAGFEGEQKFSRLINQDKTELSITSALSTQKLNGVILCAGDQVKLEVLDGEDFNGLYVVNAEGYLDLPFLGAQQVASKSLTEVSAQLENLLIQERWFYRGFAKVSISIVYLAPVQVSVSGAVFMPGRVTINQKPADVAEPQILQRSGSFSLGRDLAAAITAAGGIRPDAKIDKVYIKRGDNYYEIDLTGLLTGKSNVQSPAVISNDEIFVQTSGVEDSQLIRASQITPPGMRVFMSNLTAPAFNNANSAVGNDSTRLPYGTNLLEAAVSANCVGGTQSANASRSIVLITRTYGSRRSLVIERKIDHLLAGASDHQLNPFIMPDDAVACYDSRFTNFRDVARGFVEILSPLFVFGAIF